MSKTSNQSKFAGAPSADIKRSTFDRDHTHKTTFNASQLIPIYVDEVLPGDTFELYTSFVCRTTTPIFPVMDDIELEFFFFFTPCRLLFDGWQALHGENKETAWTPTVAPALVPLMPFGQGVDGMIYEHSIGDYFGLPININLTDAVITALPFRAYGLIWNEWFRDQNLQAPIIIHTGSIEGDGWTAQASEYHPSNAPFMVNKKHDYFTTCLPAPQKSTSVYIPLEDVTVFPSGASKTLNPNPQPLFFRDVTGGAMATGNLGMDSSGMLLRSTDIPSGFAGGGLVPTNLVANTSTAGTITALRQAFQLQKLFERDARGGTRYTEIIRSHFGVVSPDSRLQRPEYLGGFKQMLSMSQVPQTSESGATPQGNVAAYSVTGGKGGQIRQSFTEHGYVLGFLTARSRKTYGQGIERMWRKRDRFDFYYPALAHISEQPVYTSEIFANDINIIDFKNQVFGYQEAWAEYRYKPNRVSGLFRTTADQSLSAWHYADHYDTTPYLSDEFIQDNTLINMDRTLAVSFKQAPQFIADILIRNRATRPMPVYSVPGLVDHF